MDVFGSVAGLGSITRHLTQLADTLNMDKLQAKQAEEEIQRVARHELEQESTGSLLPPVPGDTSEGAYSSPSLVGYPSHSPPGGYTPASSVSSRAVALPLPPPLQPQQPPARTVDPTSAADAAFLEDMEAVGVDPTAPPPVLPPAPPPPTYMQDLSAPWRHGRPGDHSTPGSLSRRAPLATQHHHQQQQQQHQQPQSRSTEILSQIFPAPLTTAASAGASVLGEAFSRTATAASDTFGTMAREGSSALQFFRRASTAVGGGGGVVGPSNAFPPPAHSNGSAVGSTSAPSFTDNAIFTSLRSAWAGTLGSAPGSLSQGGGAVHPSERSSALGGVGAVDRSGNPIPSSFSPPSGGKGLNPALLGAATSGASSSGPWAVLLASLESKLQPIIGPLCCVLVPVALCVRGGVNVASLVVSMLGCSRLSSILSSSAPLVTPRVILLFVFIYLLAYLAWHYAILGESGALEWGDLNPTRGVGPATAVGPSGSDVSHNVPPTLPPVGGGGGSSLNPIIGVKHLR